MYVCVWCMGHMCVYVMCVCGVCVGGVWPFVTIAPLDACHWRVTFASPA